MTEAGRKWLKIAAGVGIAGLLVVGFLWFRCGIRGCPDVDLLNGYVPDQASILLDRDGEEIGKLYAVQRTVISLDSIPEHVPAAFVSVEDREFWEHGGVNWTRAGGALLSNVKAGGVEEGFSTITMQLARNMFPEQLPADQRTLWRKLGEIRVAQQIEGRYTKEEIIEMYLNQIYFGEGAWGIEAAAQEYFGKSATELSVAEAAVLAGVPKAPSRLNPRADREASRERRNLVLDRMVEEGKLESSEAEKLKEEPIKVVKAEKANSSDAAPYFVEHVRKILEDQLGQAIYTEGYRIHTTLDLGVQRATEAELEKQLAALERGAYGAFRKTSMKSDTTSGDPGYLQGAAVIMSPENGDVLALVGGRNFEDSKFNRATQAARQPGSAFKPFVYAAAVEAGYPPTMPIEDTPLRLVRDGQTWEPKNYDGGYSGRVTMREALVHSKNVATIRLAQQVGLDRIIQTAQRMGLSREIPPYPSVVLGTTEVTPLELTAAYTAFASLGSRAEPRFVTAVEDRDGGTVWAQPVSTQRTISPEAAFVVTTMLSDVVGRGTATGVRAAGFRAPAAGKTGTTNDGTDAWFVGYTPDIVGTVWIGFDEPQSIVGRASGGELAAPVWGRIMRRIKAGGTNWRMPPGVERLAVDQFGNALAMNCPGAESMRQEYFLAGRAPTGSCGGGWATSYPMDTLGIDMAPDGEDGWWSRVRSRFFREEPEVATEMDENRDGIISDIEVETAQPQADPSRPDLQAVPQTGVFDPEQQQRLPPRTGTQRPRPTRVEPPPRKPAVIDTTVKLLGDPVPRDTSGTPPR